MKIILLSLVLLAGCVTGKSTYTYLRISHPPKQEDMIEYCVTRAITEECVRVPRRKMVEILGSL